MAGDVGHGGRVLVVVNPAARGGAAELLAAVERVCRSAGCVPVTLTPDGAAGAVAVIGAVVDDGGPWQAVLAVGGDGTVRTCAEALAGGEVPMAVVPAGTGNSLYRALWEDRPWDEVLAEVLSGERTGDVRVREVDLLAVRGEPSGEEAVAMLGATAGLIAEVVRVSEGLSGVSGRERYAAATVPALEAHEPFPVRVVLDGEVLVEGPVSLVAVGGARHRSGTFQLLPRSVLDDGLLDVCVIGGVGAAGFVELAGDVVAGEHLGHPEVAYGQGRAGGSERPAGAPRGVEHDGDLWTAADTADDAAVEVAVSGSVKVLAPPDPVAG